MSYAEKHLIAGETVHYETRLHWIAMLGHALIAVVLGLIGGSLLLIPWSSVKGGEAAPAALRWAGAAFVLAGAIFFGAGLLRRSEPWPCGPGAKRPRAEASDMGFGARMRV